MRVGLLLSSLTLVVVCLAGCATVAPQVETFAPLPVTSSPTLKVLSWNVNYGLAGTVDDAKAVLAEDADVVLLQETTPLWEQWARRHLHHVYPHQEFEHHPAAGGLAVLSKTPLTSTAYLPSPVGWFDGGVVVVNTDVGRVQMLNVHLHPPVTESGNFVLGAFTTDDERETEMASFLDELDPTLPTLVAGDFNEKDGGALRHADERGLVCGVHTLLGDVDTWHWPLGPIELTNALDHILHDNWLAVVDAAVLHDVGRSDHVPLTLTLVATE